MKISKIKKIGNKYQIVFNDDTVLKTYDDVILNHGLLYNKDIDNSTLQELNNDTNYYDVYYKTVNYISKKLRSEKEVNEYIDKMSATADDAAKVIKKLKEIGLINDKAFAQAYLSDRINLSNDGPFKIKKALQEYGVKDEIIEEVMFKIDNGVIYDKLLKIITKKVKNSKYSGYILKQKIINELINNGYSKDMICEIYDSLDISNDDALKKEYNRLYKQLSPKYSDIELQNKIRMKLYQKGFSKEEINKILITQ